MRLPTFGGTSASDNSYPDLETCLFELKEIKAIELEDFQNAVEGQNEASRIGSPEWRSQNAQNAANSRHNKPGGSREKQRQMRLIWASGKYTNRDRCAEEECDALGISFSTARKALRKTPDPTPST